MINRNIILDLCGGTGSWSRPYKAAGYDVRVLTLPGHDVTKTVFNHDKKELTVNDMTINVKRITGILAAPPCTEFSLAKGSSPRDFREAMEVVNACLDIVWFVQCYGRLVFWALENPRGLLRRFLGRPAFTFEQWQYGNDKIKPTDLWGYFNPPEPTVGIRPGGLTESKNNRTYVKGWSLRTNPYDPEHKEYLSRFNTDARRAAMRAITPGGFAEAFYLANMNECDENIERGGYLNKPPKGSGGMKGQLTLDDLRVCV